MAEKNDMKVGSVLNAVVLVTDAQLLTDRRGQSYYNLKVNLKGGRPVAAKVWSDNIGDRIERGHAMDAMARVEQFKGELQLNLQRYSIVPAESFDPAPYIRTADINVEEAFDTLFDWEKESFTNPLLKRIMRLFYDNENFASRFKFAPAAGDQHHNYRSGLLEHTLDVWNLASAVAENYRDGLEREILLAGAALHDIGKIHCYRLVSGVSEHTESGMLIDHIFIGASMLSNLWDARLDPAASGVSKDDALRLKNLLLHLLLSHHGKKEWGAPVLPKTPEAISLHFCDQISATMRNCFDRLDNLPEGEEWTEWVTVMDEGRKLFRDPQSRGRKGDNKNATG